MGRTGVDKGGVVIPNKTVSRRHLTIEVGEATADDAATPDSRSKLTIEDLNTKIGTLVNGEQIKGSSRTLSGDSFEIKLAHYEAFFRIKWQPMLFTFSLVSVKNPIEPFCESLGPLDVKVDGVFLPTKTTHVIAAKRNTPKGLQALIGAKYLVNYTFIDAVIAAAKSTEDGPSSLELDFDGSWPEPSDFLPPKGQEPTKRPDKAYAPDTARHDIFDGYTFVFYCKPQFENLIGPITDGKGKALYREVRPRVSTIDDFVGYVKNVAGEKGLGSFDDGSEGKGVVVVRWLGKGDDIPWFEGFVRDVSLRLDHRMIEQGDFIDAILNNDASVLRRPLEMEQSSAPSITAPEISLFGGMIPQSSALERPPPSTATTHTLAGLTGSQDGPPESSAPPQAEPEPPRRAVRSRRGVVSRFKGFDDFDTPISMEDVPSQVSSAAPVPEPSLFVSQTSQTEAIINNTGRKRTLSPMIEDSEEDVMESLAPAASRLKRQKLMQDAERRDRGETTPPPDIPAKPERITPKRKKPEINILEHTRQQREQAELLAKQEREALAHVMDGMDIEAIRNLAIVEEMTVQRTKPRPVRLDDDEVTPRWDEAWNGRKNFKRFRRRGEERTRRAKVIVPLEVVQRKGFGIGDEYWLESGKKNNDSLASMNGRGKSQSQVSQASKVRSQASNAQTANGSAQPVGSVSHDDAGRIPDSKAQAARDEDESLPDIRAVVQDSMPSSRSQRALARTQTQSTQATKRPANEPMSRPAKKSKPTPAPAKSTRTVTVIEDDSDDGEGFRFGRRKRG